jgi:hypothetical protein
VTRVAVAGATGHSRPWDITIKIAVKAAAEAGARAVVDQVIAAMGVMVAGTPPFVRFDDGIWATELKVTNPVFDVTEEGAMNVLSTLLADLDPVTWRGVSDSPFDPDSARAGQVEWPPGFWALAGRRETLVHPSVHAMLLQISA